MEPFFVFLGLVAMAFPIIAIVALVKTINLGERIRGLEARLAGLTPGAAILPGAAAKQWRWEPRHVDVARVCHHLIADYVHRQRTAPAGAD